MKSIIFFIFQIQLLGQCIVPSILLETIKLTENETSYVYWIRTNDSRSLNKFYDIAKNFKFNTTKDSMLIDCIDNLNCIELTKVLIRNDIKNLDLGLFQINYKKSPFELNTYFDEQLSYIAACKVLKEKIKIAKNNWSWEVLASYYSSTPHLNKIYKKKLIDTYIKLTKN